MDEAIEAAIVRNDLICAAAISENRNFEARIHPNLSANFLMSSPLVVAFSIAGTMLRDFEKERLGIGSNGEDVFLRDIWPARDEVTAMMKYAANPQIFRELYRDLTKHIELWNSVDAVSGIVYTWPASTYIAEPPFFVGFEMKPKKVEGIVGDRVLGIFGDSGTTDHISPAGSIKESSPAGRYQLETVCRSQASRATGHGVAIMMS